MFLGSVVLFVLDVGYFHFGVSVNSVQRFYETTLILTLFENRLFSRIFNLINKSFFKNDVAQKQTAYTTVS